MIPSLAHSKFNAAYFADVLKYRRWRFAVWAVLLSAVFTGVLIVLGGNLIIPMGAILGLIVMGLAWQFPKTIYYVSLLGACTIETYPLHFQDSTTDLVPLFWDVNTIVQVYFKLTNFHAVPVSFFEILLIISCLSWLIRCAHFKTRSITFGTMFVPIFLYCCCVAVGLFNGLMTGGTFNIALFEVRAQFYFLFAYMMAVNGSKDVDRQATILMWAATFGIGFKGIISCWRYFITCGGVTVPELGIGSHEESFFFNCYIFQYLVLKLADLQPKLRTWMLVFLPLVVIADLANERRAATAALVVALIAMLVLLAVAFPKRRKAVAITTTIIAVISAIYLPLAWNGNGAFAQPARAIKSQFTPDARDQSSDDYRDAENANLMATMRMSPIIGYGYGKPVVDVVQIIDLSSVDPLIKYMTHNQILWVWMRVGTVGFYFFWVMVTAIIMQGCQVLRNPGASLDAKAVALIGILIIAMQMVFGLLDLQISNLRNMLYCGLWTGTISAVATAYPFKEVLPPPLKKFGSDVSYGRWKLPEPETLRT